MTYLEFHVYLIVPAILLGGLAWTGLERKGGTPSSPDPLSELGALALISGIAFCYTLPWDHLLITWAVWTYDVERIAATLWGVPVEECAFFVLQPILAGSWYAVVVRLYGPGQSSSSQTSQERAFLPVLFSPAETQESRGSGVLHSKRGGMLGGLITVLGIIFIVSEGAFYLGMILLWSGPVLALQWGLRGKELWRRGRTIALAVGTASLFLWIADRIALGAQIWRISPRYTVGISPFGLPLEEALFFLVTNLLVVQGLVMLTDPGPD